MRVLLLDYCHVWRCPASGGHFIVAGNNIGSGADCVRAMTISTGSLRPTAPAVTIRRPGIGRRAVPIVAAGSVGLVWGVLCFLPDLPQAPVTGICTIGVVVGFAVAAVVVGEQPARGRVGLLLAVAGLLWPLNGLGGWSDGLMPVIRQLTEAAFWVVLLAAVLVYQRPRFAWPERLFLGWVSLQLVGGAMLWMVLARPEWVGFASGTWWPSWAADRELFDLCGAVLAALYVPAAMLFTGIVVVRQRREVPLDRYSIAPVVTAVAVAGLSAGISWSAFERTTVAVAVVLLPLPAAFIYSATRLTGLRRRLGEALDAGPGSCPETSGAAMLAALRTVLRDPGLTVAFWSPERREWVDEVGEVVRRDSAGGGRIEVPISRQGDRLSAVVSTVASSPAARREVAAAVRLAGTAIENAGLRALVRAQVDAVSRAHARTVQAGLEERRRLEQDLHDGAQQRLLGVLALLAAVRRGTADPAVAAVADAEDEIRTALAELRDLAHGLHPSALSRDGLPAALTELTRRLALPADVRVDVDRFDPAVETTVYFIVCEMLTNVAKHARADRVWVRIAAESDAVEVDIRDDGVGGADPAGHGLTGIVDRVVALGGHMTLRSDTGTGTWVQVWLPCK